MDNKELDFYPNYPNCHFYKSKKSLTVSRWNITPSTLCSLRTCHKHSVSKEQSIRDLKLMTKVFSAWSASADAKTKKQQIQHYSTFQ